ncbi:hypothetical protein GYMLUDRAFT_895174 [Collybiopsis luxurians FD-317 M1]|uniref:Uncharacterized protein n=1 Tax=Collybiopsis luxurians FD-317 M1 TaxID=944289 RepID=A0A0D0AVQ5_9AGAR|nr:hypothetical protein GYMLUDRAFT_895174 [Collybiopsis luxurians FD-317 M1]
MRLAEQRESSDKPHKSPIRLSVPLPAVQVNGQMEDNAPAPSDEGDALLSPADTYENSGESEVGASPRKSRSSYADSSQNSLASGPSIVSLTMFPEPPSLVPSESTVRKPTGSSKPTAEAVSVAVPLSLTPSNGTSESSPTSPAAKPKTLLSRLPSLKKKGRKADTEPVPPLPSVNIHRGHVEKSPMLSVSIPHMTPRAPIVRDEFDDDSPPATAVPTIPTPSAIPLTPTTPRMPSTPSTPRYSQSAQAKSQDHRISLMTTTSGLSVSSSLRGVDWNHNNSSLNGSSEPPTPRTPVPETPTMILSESEKRHVRMWIRQCPTLRQVVFISGAEWGL